MDASNGIAVSGVYHLEHRRDGEIVQSIDQKNLITNAGINAIINKVFHQSSILVSQFYDGSAFIPYVNDYTPSATDTYAQFLTNAGELTFPGYTTRAGAGFNSATFQYAPKSRSTPDVTIAINTNTTIYGIALVLSTIGSTVLPVGSSTNGTLVSVMKLDTPLVIESGESLTMRYTLSFSST